MQPVGSPRKGPALTAAKLEAYLGYQRSVLGVLSALTGEVDAVALDGGEEAVLEAVGRQALQDERARKASGLTEAEIAAFEELSAGVLTRRMTAQMMDYGGLLEQMERLKASLPKEQQAGVEASISELKREQAELAQLSEERARFGSAEVDLILGREAELTANWLALMDQLGGER